VPSVSSRKKPMNVQAPWRRAIAASLPNPRQLAQMTRALAKTADLNEIKEIRDWAEAARRFARSAGHGPEFKNRAAELKLAAERRAGELLAGLALRGGDHKSNSRGERVSLESLGIDHNESARWQREAAVPEAVFKRYVAAASAAHEDITAQGLLRLQKSLAERASKARRLPKAALLVPPNGTGAPHNRRRRPASKSAVGSRSRR
jgi:hypothetical protein